MKDKTLKGNVNSLLYSPPPRKCGKTCDYSVAKLRACAENGVIQLILHDFQGEKLQFYLKQTTIF